MNLEEERMRLLVKISNMYYVEGINQQEIANRLNISRPQVSRMLSTAKNEGIVTISIKNPFTQEQEIERAIKEIFGIRDAMIVDVQDKEPKAILNKVARVGATLIESILKNNDIVGVMAGKAVNALSKEIEYSGGSRENIQFVPLVGGWGAEGTNFHANSNTQNMAEKFNGRYLLLNAPAIVLSQQTRELILKEPHISNVLQLARKSNIAILGIGQISSHSTIVESGFLPEKELDEVRKRGAIANICSSFIDSRGDIIDFPMASRIIGLTLEEISKIPQAIAIATGEEKIPAITAALRGRWVDILITDLATAKGILEWHRLHPAKKPDTF